MAMSNPRGRVNYEPNSWGDAGGPRESAQLGFRSFAAPAAGDKLRVRAETFADHYSQARQFFVSQTANEQKHLGDALVFELSKVEEPAIRMRVVSHLLNIHEDLAKFVAKGLGLGALPKAADAARPTRLDLPASAALSVARNGPKSFKARKVGLLMTDGADARLFVSIAESLAKEGALHEVVAPTIAGVRLSNGENVAAKHTVSGGPSVLFDAVAILVSDAGGRLLASDASARDFVADAFAHLKVIGYAPSAMPLLEKAGVATALDEACLALEGPADASRFVAKCRGLRHWPREFALDPA